LTPKLVSKVFIVDDEEIIAKSLGLILGSKGFDVFPFTNPLRALDQMEEVGPDLLISDVMMPQLSGIELAIRTRATQPDCRILLFTASTSDLLKQAREDGHDFRLLRKPVHPTQLLLEIGLLQNQVKDTGGAARTI
jgi:CheY-like chemotaxis protein